MHIFLTGEIQVGKSTIIRSFMSKSGLTADGFLTSWQTGNDGITTLFLVAYNERTPRWPIARKTPDRFELDPNIDDTFNVIGSRILDQSGRHDLIIMDELGVLESRAHNFQSAVMQRLSGSTPILGVLKQRSSQFLDSVGTHPKVRIFTVNTDNRNNILDPVLRDPTFSSYG